MTKKIESTILPRAFALLALLTVVDGCAKAHQNHAQAATALPQTNGAATTATTASGSGSIEWADVPINALPHGQMLTRLDAHDAPRTISSQEKIAGINVDEVPGSREIWGSTDREKAESSMKNNPVDPPEDAYCLALMPVNNMMFQGSKLSMAISAASAAASTTPVPPESSMLGYVADLTQQQERIDIERVEGDKLTMINGWVTQDGGMRQVGKRDVTMKALASMSGVDVFAFVEEAAPKSANAAPSAASTVSVPSVVDVVIRRPPIKHERVRGRPFLGVLPDGSITSATCRHIRVALPIIKGDGSTATFMLPVESETGARAVRVNMSSLWLASDAQAHVTARIEWDGPEAGEFPPPARRNTRSRSKMGGRF